MIVAFEGIDASGKATQVEALKKRIFKQLKTTTEVKTLSFPQYSSTAGGVIERILKGQTIVAPLDRVDYHRSEWVPTFHSRLQSQWSRDKSIILQSMFVCDRLEAMPLLAEFALSPNNFLLVDRYKLSGVAYGCADGLDLNWLNSIQSCLPDADLNILLDIPIEESFKRRPDRRDSYESDLDKLANARTVYHQQFEAGDKSEFQIMDGMLEPHDLTMLIATAIWRRSDQLGKLNWP